MGSDGDALVDRGCLQVVEVGAGFRVQTSVFLVGYHQPATLQYPYDASIQGDEQTIKFLAVRNRGTVYLIGFRCQGTI